MTLAQSRDDTIDVSWSAGLSGVLAEQETAVVMHELVVVLFAAVENVLSASPSAASRCCGWLAVGNPRACVWLVVSSGLMFLVWQWHGC